METKSSTKRDCFLYKDLSIDNFRLLMTLCPDSSDLGKFSSPKYSQFAVECD